MLDRNLHEEFVEYIISTIDTKDNDEIPRIIKNLLFNQGYLTVAGHPKDYFCGGIGNFISCKETENAVGCFDWKISNSFFVSGFYEELMNQFKQLKVWELNEAREAFKKAKKANNQADRIIFRHNGF